MALSCEWRAGGPRNNFQYFFISHTVRVHLKRWCWGAPLWQLQKVSGSIYQISHQFVLLILKHNEKCCEASYSHTHTQVRQRKWRHLPFPLGPYLLYVYAIGLPPSRVLIPASLFRGILKEYTWQMGSVKFLKEKRIISFLLNQSFSQDNWPIESRAGTCHL